MQSLDPVFSWFFVISLCIISLVSVLSNAIVLTWKPSNPDVRFIYVRLRHLLTSEIIANLSTTLVTIPLWLFILIRHYYNQESVDLVEINEICLYSFDVLHGLLVSLHLLIIAIERLYATVWPIIHRTASDRVTYVASILSWFIASSVSSIVVMVFYFTKSPSLVVFNTLVCLGLPCFVVCVLYLSIPAKLTRRVITPSQKRDLKLAKAMALVFVSFVVVSLPYQTVNLISYFCSSCGASSLALSLGLRCLYYSGAAVVPVVTILLVGELRTKVEWCCFRFHAINEQSRNELYTMEIPGIQTRRNTSCTLVTTKTNDQRKQKYQNRELNMH